MKPIKKNIPIPKQSMTRGKYPWHEMDVGDAFETDGSQSSASSSVTYRNHRMKPKKFYSGYHEGKWHIWRIE